MHVEILEEHGYNSAVLGFSLSYNSTIERTKEILPKYAFGKPGENKFLESIYIWLDVTAPRFWWQEADTYRLSSKQSESTMHTLTKAPLTDDNFEYGIMPEDRSSLALAIHYYNTSTNRDEKSQLLAIVKSKLPEGFLQRRIWVMNYKCLQNIYIQRYNHRLPQWKYFCEEMLKQIEHPEFIRRSND